MNNLNEEDLVSVDDINNDIVDFIRKHPENISTWVDGKTVTIQLSNIGVRDKVFSRLAYLAENTTIENSLTIFDMPAKCIYASNQIIRFTCTVNELVSTVNDFNNPPPGDSECDAAGELDRAVYNTPSIDKFYKRLTRSSALKKAQAIINKSSHKIKVYIISDCEEFHPRDEGSYVTYNVIDIMEIDANTTWESFQNELPDLMTSVGRKVGGPLGVFNILLNGNVTEKTKIVNDVFINQLPEFVFDPSIKVGDKIDSRDYVNEWLWPDDGHHQVAFNDYQHYENFCGNFPVMDGITGEPYEKTLIPDGAIIII